MHFFISIISLSLSHSLTHTLALTVLLTYRQIQEILVSTGDKDASLIGSTQWLGSFELGYILDAYLGITYKVRRAAPSAELGRGGG